MCPLMIVCRLRWQLDGTISLDLTRDLHRLIAVDIGDDAFDGRAHLLSAMFGKKDLAKEISLQKDRSGAVGAGFIPPTSGNLRTIVLRTLFPLPQHCMSAEGLATLTLWLQMMPNEQCRLRLLLSAAPMYHWACAPSTVAQLMKFLGETRHAALLLALMAAQIGPFQARSDLINSVCRSGVHLNVIHAATVMLDKMAAVDSSNLNGHYSFILTQPMASFLLRIILHRDTFVCHTLSQRNVAVSRPRSRGAEQPQHVEYPPSCLHTLALPPTNEDYEVPQLSPFAEGVLQNQIFALISDNGKLQSILQGLGSLLPQHTSDVNCAVMTTASGLEKLVQSRFRLLHNAPVVAFSIKCTSSVKVCYLIVIPRSALERLTSVAGGARALLHVGSCVRVSSKTLGLLQVPTFWRAFDGNFWK